MPLVETPDLLASLARHSHRPSLLIGFAAETEDVLPNARAKLERKGCDWIVANDVSPGTGIMGGERNRVHLVTADGVEDWPDMSKTEVAARLVARIAGYFDGAPAREPAPEFEPRVEMPAAKFEDPPRSEAEHERPLPDGSLDFRPTR